ncbi:MAG TPA: tRNA (adenosine(37)-N6)-threonylcarbamoyltransferase complex dimerization subunit type 1 TsaB, partial [Chlamydiales bacterium]
MKELIIDTSGEEGLLALVSPGKIWAEKRLAGGPDLSKNLGLEVKKIISLSQGPYDRITVGIGPGSFTGIRVGVSMAESLSMGWNIPLYTVCSLSGFVPDSPGDFAIVVDARSGGFYVQFNSENPRLIKVQEASEILISYPRIFSPHPLKIQERLPSISCLQGILSPSALSRFAEKKPPR